MGAAVVALVVPAPSKWDWPRTDHYHNQADDREDVFEFQRTSLDYTYLWDDVAVVRATFVRFFRDVLARGVGRREQKLGLFRCCGCSDNLISVGLGSADGYALWRRVSRGRAARACWRRR